MPNTSNAQSTAKRVPITMNADEIGTLEKLAQHEQRSVAAMAGIIYRAGLEQYGRKTKTRARR
ncbi:hypothetical protein R70211_00183 [Paraburkholderia domus]|jgi:hypothetical protein|uniref:Uncharacterized protein n=1 Tax=Paraburkholderia domus TaxID=2793075 RepID=A0A9N8MJT5_9BURK|nr:hypothetical protein [Burkholderia sp. R-70211]CAE6856310.1 hypothetical protein R70211_00183 [Paraburkholderia domus]